MAEAADRPARRITRKTFLAAGGCVALAAVLGRGLSRGAAGTQTKATTRPRRAENLRQVARGGTVELRPKPVDPRGPVFRLNRSATVVWDAVDGRRTVDDISAALAATYGLAPRTARADTIACLDALAVQGLVTGIPGTRAGGPTRQS